MEGHPFLWKSIRLAEILLQQLFEWAGPGRIGSLGRETDVQWSRTLLL